MEPKADMKDTSFFYKEDQLLDLMCNESCKRRDETVMNVLEIIQTFFEKITI